MAGCKCNGTLGNTGTPDCFPIEKVTLRDFYVPRYASDGTENKIDLSTEVINDAFITARINDPDPTKRWYPSPKTFKNVEDTRGDSTREEFNDGSSYFIQQGARTFTGMIPGMSARVLKNFEEYGCVELGVYKIDKDGSLIGSRRDGVNTDNLYPILIDKGSWDPKLVKMTDSTAPGIQIMYTYDMIEKDGDLWMIPAADMTVNLLTVRGLKDVIATVGSITTTGHTLTLKEAMYGAPITGLVITDFFDEVGGSDSESYNVTDGAAVTLSSVTETAPGVYALVYSAQTSGDIIRDTIVKNGYDFSEVSELVITTP